MKIIGFQGLQNNNNIESSQRGNISNDKNNQENTKKICINKKILIPIIIITLILIIVGAIILLKIIKKENKSPTPIKILLSDFNYEESESILNLEIIGNNTILISKALNNINNLLIIYKNHNLSEINSKINYNPPSFLENPTKNNLKIVKSDLEFYERKYSELSEEINNITSLYIKLLN